METIFDEADSMGKDTSSPAPPERVVSFVRRVIRGEKFYGGAERRTDLRYPLTMPVRVTPLDSDRRPDGHPFLAVTRDISVGGLCFYHTQSVKQRYLQLELTGPDREQFDVVLEVVRGRQAGPFFEIAGRFIGYA